MRRNSISFYDWANHPASQSYFYSHNNQSRPPFNNATNWGYHETLTTDGPGGWGAGIVAAADGTTVVVPKGLVPLLDPTGATAVVVQGPGAGQFRAVTARLNETAIVLSAPFDEHVAYGSSIVAVVATVGGKLVTGKRISHGLFPRHRQLYRHRWIQAIISRGALSYSSLVQRSRPSLLTTCLIIR